MLNKIISKAKTSSTKPQKASLNAVVESTSGGSSSSKQDDNRLDVYSQMPPTPRASTDVDNQRKQSTNSENICIDRHDIHRHSTRDERRFILFHQSDVP